jgi:hypothetical protein
LYHFLENVGSFFSVLNSTNGEIMGRPKKIDFKDSWFSSDPRYAMPQVLWNTSLMSPGAIDRSRELLRAEAIRRGLSGKTWITSGGHIGFLSISLAKASEWSLRYNPPYDLLKARPRDPDPWNRIFRDEGSWNEFIPGEDYHLGKPGDPERLKRRICCNALTRGLRAITWELPPSAQRPNGSLLAYTIRGQYL